MQDEKPKTATQMIVKMIKSFFIGNNNTNKFERKNCIFKICGMGILRINIIGALICLISYSAFGQTRINQTGDLSKMILPNDLNAILLHSTSLPNVEITLFIKTGSIYEGDSMNGMANLVENILAEKNRELPAQQPDGRIFPKYGL